jgi:hypothetical protein
MKMIMKNRNNCATSQTRPVQTFHLFFDSQALIGKIPMNLAKVKNGFEAAVNVSMLIG